MRCRWVSSSKEWRVVATGPSGPGHSHRPTTDLETRPRRPEQQGTVLNRSRSRRHQPWRIPEVVGQPPPSLRKPRTRPASATVTDTLTCRRPSSEYARSVRISTRSPSHCCATSTVNGTSRPNPPGSARSATSGRSASRTRRTRSPHHREHPDAMPPRRRPVESPQPRMQRGEGRPQRRLHRPEPRAGGRPRSRTRRPSPHPVYVNARIAWGSSTSVVGLLSASRVGPPPSMAT